MADDSGDAREPNLELPKIFGRKKQGSPRSTIGRPPAFPAAILTGVVVGLVGTGLTVLGFHGCHAARGTTSCGGGPGLTLLVLIVLVMALVGIVLLRVLGVEPARTIAVLGTALICVVAMLLLSGVLFSVWMFLAIPLIGAATFGLAYWVNTAFVEVPNDDRADLR
jgi:hypothetical protein